MLVSVSLTPSGAFYDLAGTVLSRPLPPRDALTMQDLVARFYATGRLLPLFENSSAPQAAYAPALRARHSELFNEIEAARREQLASQFELHSMTPTEYVDPLRSQADELAHCHGPAGARRQSRSRLSRAAVRNRFWDRARRAAAEIEDEAVRARALTFIQVTRSKTSRAPTRTTRRTIPRASRSSCAGPTCRPSPRRGGLAQAAVIAARKKQPDAQVRQIVAELIDEAEGYRRARRAGHARARRGLRRRDDGRRARRSAARLGPAEGDVSRPPTRSRTSRATTFRSLDRSWDSAGGGGRVQRRSGSIPS